MKKDISPFIEENLDEDSGFLLLRISKLWEEAHEKALKKHYDLSHMQYAILASVHWLILHGQYEITQVKLAKHTKISPMTISQSLKVLEQKGYVHREICSTDARARYSFLTPKGKELMQKAFVTIFEADEKFFNTLGKNRKKLNQYMAELLWAND